LSAKSGISHPTISLFENGKRAALHTNTMVAICRAFSAAGIEFTRGSQSFGVRIAGAPPESVLSATPRHPRRQLRDGRAKAWSLMAPNGTRYDFVNLARFLIEHAELFDAHDLTPFPSNPNMNRAAVGLSRLRRSRIELRRGKRVRPLSWKGWRWGTEE
jgi:hypothetical protein